LGDDVLLLYVAAAAEDLLVTCVRTPCPRLRDFSAAVLLSVGGCNHLDCHGGPFLLVYLSVSP
jgi:hypothetical protein